MRKYRRSGVSANDGFTLVEMLVVLAIIVILAALLFPVFRRARENARQAHCASNLQKIGQAVKAYFLDYKRYPRTLTDLQKYLDFKVTGAQFASGSDQFLCRDDLRQFADPLDLRSSYGGYGLLVNLNAPVPTDPTIDCDAANLANHPQNCPMGVAGYNPSDPWATSATAQVLQRHWNYWGYANPNPANPGWGVALRRSSAIPTCTNTYSAAMLVTDSPFYWHEVQKNACPPNQQIPPPPGVSSWSDYPALANPSAPDNTIVTHCWNHRPVTGTFNPATTWSDDTVEIILRLGGEAKAVKLSTLQTKWVSQGD